jgi:hypothetical protein
MSATAIFPSGRRRTSAGVLNPALVPVPSAKDPLPPAKVVTLAAAEVYKILTACPIPLVVGAEVPDALVAVTVK